jgi:hypothetical protein
MNHFNYHRATLVTSDNIAINEPITYGKDSKTMFLLGTATQSTSTEEKGWKT